jgi:hypothetical protein
MGGPEDEDALCFAQIETFVGPGCAGARVSVPGVAVRNRCVVSTIPAWAVEGNKSVLRCYNDPGTGNWNLMPINGIRNPVKKLIELCRELRCILEIPTSGVARFTTTFKCHGYLGIWFGDYRRVTVEK